MNTRHKSLWAVVVVWVSLGPVPASADLLTDAPESKDYQLLLDLTIPEKASFHTTPPKYAVDNSATFKGSFARVAYHLELQKKEQPRRFVWVSMEAFTTDVSKLGVPHAGATILWQQLVKNMNVLSNHPGVKAGAGIKTGNIEFWPSNYSAGNGAGIPGASGAVYDSGDTAGSGAGYGSMQVHDHGAKTTLFAYNAWSNSALGSDLGIGNNNEKASNGALHSDWTFRRNSGEYSLRRLRVLVKPGPTPGALVMQTTSPGPYQVVQRDDAGLAWVPVAGQLSALGTVVEARALALNGGLSTGWQVVDPKPKATFSGHVQVQQGWYDLEVRLRKGQDVVAQATAGPFGVGEVFITAGQSNSANSGKPALKPTSGKVGAWGPSGWQLANDPQPIATGGGGTPWPVLGDLLVAKYGVPVGFISVGWGGTSVLQWQPGHSKQLYPRLLLALSEVGLYGARAVLWHQGESDSAGKMPATTYTKLLLNVIGEMRKAAGWDIPWGIARVGYLPKADPTAIAAVVAGQNAVIAADPANFAGPTTDDLIGDKWRHDTVHFNEAGLKEHAKRWADAIPTPSVTLSPADAGDADAGGGSSDAGATTDAGEQAPDAASSDAPLTDETSDSLDDAAGAEDAVAAVDDGADGQARADDVPPVTDSSAAVDSGAADSAHAICDCPTSGPSAEDGCGVRWRRAEGGAAQLAALLLCLCLVLRRRRSTPLS